MTMVPHLSRFRPPVGRRSPGASFRQALHYLLHLTGFACSTLVMTWGVLAIAFLALGGFSLDGLMLHLANLANRYNGADPARVAAFKQTFGIAHFVVVAALLAIRRRAILPSDVIRGDHGHG